MATDEEREQAMIDNAAGPAEASGDSGSVKQHRITDQIALDKHLAAKRAASANSPPIRYFKLVPPGAGS